MTVRYYVLNPGPSKRGRSSRKKTSKRKSMARTKRRRMPLRNSKGRFVKRKRSSSRRSSSTKKRKRATRKRSSARRSTRRKASTARRRTRRKTTRVRARRGTTVVVRANPGKKKHRPRRFGKVYRPYVRWSAKRKKGVMTARVKRRLHAYGTARRNRSGQYVLNPRRKRRRNPPKGLMTNLKRNLKSLTRPDVYVGAVQGMAGFSAALILPQQLAARVPQLARYNSGYYGVALSAASTAVAAALAAALPMRGSAKLAGNVMAGGLMATVTKLLFAASPQWGAKLLPLGELQGGSAPLAAALRSSVSLSASPSLQGLAYSRAARLPQAVGVGSWSPSAAEAF